MDPVQTKSVSPSEALAQEGHSLIKKDYTLVVILSITTLLATLIAFFFYFQNQQLRKLLTVVPSPLATPLASPQPTTDPTANWKIISVDKCGFSIKLPDGWATANNTTPDIQTSQSLGCILINAPDYTNKESNNGLQIAISKTAIGSKFNNVQISDLDSYINAERKTIDVQPATDIVSNIKSMTIGAYSGKYFELSAMFTNSYFIFNNANSIYSAIWLQSYSGNYSSEINQILSTFKFTEVQSTPSASPL